MPVTRDRLSRPVDISALLPSARRRVDLVVDEPGLRSTGLGRSPVGSVPPASNPFSVRAGGGGTPTGSARRGFGQGRNLYGSRIGRENITPRTVRRGRVGMRVRNRNSVLPSWYPRTPLRDVTAVVRAIERRRAQLNELEATQLIELQNDGPGTSSLADHNISFRTPAPVKCKPQLSRASKVRKILADIADEKESGSENLTPQRKVLNSIDKVREAWMEDQKKLEQTPAAKKAERERKIVRVEYMTKRLTNMDEIEVELCGGWCELTGAW